MAMGVKCEVFVVSPHGEFHQPSSNFQELWNILSENSSQDKQFSWKLDLNESKLTLLQDLGLDDTSTVLWAVFNLEDDGLSIDNAVQLINK